MILFLDWGAQLLLKVFGSRNVRLLKELLPTVEAINLLEPEIARLSDRAMRGRTVELRKRVAEGRTQRGYDEIMTEWRDLKRQERREEAKESRKRAALVEQEALDEVLVEAFALVREASKRTIGLRHFDVQLIGGIVLHSGKISEMVTGEGKTLVASMPAYLNALAGHGVHIVTVNDYLARRDRDTNAPIFELLGLTVGVIQQPLSSYERQKQYACDITYATNNELGFDYLRDNMKVSRESQCQGSLHYAIIDEVNSILIDEARTPLIISGASDEATDKYKIADRVARQLSKGPHFEVKEKEHMVLLSDDGQDEAQKLVGRAIGEGDDFDFYTGGNMDWPHHIDQALRAHHLYHRDKEYVVKDGEILIVDEFTGRLMPGRTWSDGLHQAIEAKEGVTVKQENQTLATITFQNFFRLYNKISGMTGTAQTEAEELHQIYKLDPITIPTNRPLIREQWPDVVYRTEREKVKAIVDEIERIHQSGRPILVGTIAIEKSEQLSDMLQRRGIQHEVLNAKNHEREAHIVANAGQLRNVTVATNMAGRGTDIILGQAPRDGSEGVPATDLTAVIAWVSNYFWAPGMKRLKAESIESNQVAGIRAELRQRIDECVATRIEEWRRATGAQVGRADLDQKSDDQRRTVMRKALKAVGKKDEYEQHRLLEPIVTLFEAADNFERYFDYGVAGMGGLHVLGTERHESRRIDNQLRGRCGRQGDPGSSQFFLSLEDDLMRIFAPERVSRILERLGMTEGQEISAGIVTSAIARAQKKVEARNFDVRKNLLDYDGVMDDQRKLVYENRQLVLEGGDPRDMIRGMIRDACRDVIEKFASDEIIESERNHAGIVEWAKSRFGPEIPFETVEIKDKNADEIEDALYAIAEELHKKREEEVGAENMRSLERFLLLQKIDEKWKDHLHGMDQLRGSIGMRGYSQLDPKIEYKKEGFQLFSVMLSSVQDEVTSLLFRVRLVSPEEEASLLGRVWGKQGPQGPQGPPPPSSAPQVHGPSLHGPPQVQTLGGGGGVSFGHAPQHMTVSSGEGDGEAAPVATELTAEQKAAQDGAAAAARAAERAREMAARNAAASQRARASSGAQSPSGSDRRPDGKVGRNDPCPCGSGKKYKKCHGEATV